VSGTATTANNGGVVAAGAAGAGAALVVGYDFGAERLFVDHSRMGNASLIQTAPLPRDHVSLTQSRTAAADADAVRKGKRLLCPELVLANRRFSSGRKRN
jgi:hypothetical protein